MILITFIMEKTENGRKLIKIEKELAEMIRTSGHFWTSTTLILKMGELCRKEGAAYHVEKNGICRSSHAWVSKFLKKHDMQYCMT